MTAEDMKNYTITSIKRLVYDELEQEAAKGYFSAGIHKRLLTQEMKDDLNANGYDISNENDGTDYVLISWYNKTI